MGVNGEPRFRFAARRGRVALIVSGAMAFALLGAGSAQATTVVLGSSLANPALNPTDFGVVSTVSPNQMPTGYTTAPFNGTIVRWSVVGAMGGPLKLRVIRQTGPPGSGLYTGAGTATSGSITGPGILTFPANLPVRATDRIGIEPTVGTDRVGATPNMTPGFQYQFFSPALVDGGMGQPPSSMTQSREVGFNATVESNCIVPSVLGLDLAAATAALDAANCDLGTVTKPKKKKARKKAGSAKKRKQKLIVRSQSVAAGTEVQGGTDVALTLGKKKKKKKKK